jgi:hypothetical protein
LSSPQERQQLKAYFLATDALIEANNKNTNSPFQLGHNLFSLLVNTYD